MRNNDVIQSIRYMLDLNHAQIAEILKLRGYDPKREEVESIFNEDGLSDEELYENDSSHKLMAYFLDGLIFHLRGKSDKHPPRPIKTPVNNNDVLKKLRVAFKFRDDDIRDILKSTGFSISKSEVNALFRDPNHKNYRICGDQVLRYFLKGLTMRVRKG